MDNMLPALENFPAVGFRRFHLPASIQLCMLYRVFILLLLLVSTQIQAQTDNKAKEVQADYKKVVTDRVVKIVNPLQIADSLKYKKVVSIIVDQYSKVNAISEEATVTSAALKAQSLPKAALDSALKIQEKDKTAKLLQQHQVFLQQLNRQLAPEQVEQVKNGMTYNLVHVTYDAYVDMIPSLKVAEKQQIYSWLVEARELAMDAESAEKKHAVFGKYKGRINNYISAQGYDSQKERAEWEARIKAKKEAGKSSN